MECIQRVLEAKQPFLRPRRKWGNSKKSLQALKSRQPISKFAKHDLKSLFE
jgi:hypothetical protein